MKDCRELSRLSGLAVGFLVSFAHSFESCSPFHTLSLALIPFHY
jgi:hypothetical protein